MRCLSWIVWWKSILGLEEAGNGPFRSHEGCWESLDLEQTKWGNFGRPGTLTKDCWDYGPDPREAVVTQVNHCSLSVRQRKWELEAGQQKAQCHNCGLWAQCSLSVLSAQCPLISFLGHQNEPHLVFCQDPRKKGGFFQSWLLLNFLYLHRFNLFRKEKCYIYLIQVS